MYWLYWFNLVIFERRNPPALLLISLTGLLSGLTLYGVLSSLSLSGLLWCASSGLLSGLPYAVPSGLSLPRLSLLLPSPLVYRRYRYANGHML